MQLARAAARTVLHELAAFKWARLLLLPLLLCMLVLPAASDHGAGWTEASRAMSAFRFEAEGIYDKRAFAIQLRQLADDVSGFGWVQISNNGTGNVVGEFRGVHRTGGLMKQFLRDGPRDAGRYVAQILDYEPARIVFHFSHFKLLADKRRTCFPSPPHACVPPAGLAEAAPVVPPEDPVPGQRTEL